MAINAITTLSSLKIDTSTNSNAINGFYLPQLTTAQRNAIPASILRGGALIFTSDANTVGLSQLYQNGGWGTVLTTTTTATGVGLVAGNSPLGIPNGESASVEVPDNEVPGFIYFDNTANSATPFRAYNASAWTTIFASLTTATGVGLDAGSSLLSIPTGPRVSVEVADNEEPGFIYYDTTSNVYRARNNTGWGTLALT